MLEDLALFSMAKRSLNWLARRQDVLAENIANANTPNYKARDVTPLDFESTVKTTLTPEVRAATTNPMHVSPAIEPAAYEVAADRRPEESKPNGNSVLLEEQMKKVGEVKGNYEMTLNLMQKNIKMLQIAIDKNS